MTLRCPKCASTNVECDGKTHICPDCGYYTAESAKAVSDTTGAQRPVPIWPDKGVAS